ncbi:MAG: hypothetical protein CL988_05645 [Euryarchaeota archaeon]|nr:hypothetical protein [Euryarchaeota archaeon]|tara:strand:+ start:400 stop:1164 length:765 start_codon:yes stop_codon:yes gene_type:complete
MGQDAEFYHDLLSRGYDPNHAMLCTKEKFPEFTLSPETFDDEIVQVGPEMAGNQSPYQPYMPVLHQEATTVNQIKDTTTQIFENFKQRVENSRLREVRVSKKALVVASGIVGLLLVSSVLILLAKDAGGPVEGNWMNNQGQRFVFSDDATAQFRYNSDAMWDSDGSSLTVVASNSGKTYTHVYRFSVSDNGKAMWLMPEKITDEAGTNYFDMPGYTPTCMLLLKSDTAPTLVEYLEKEPGYTNDTPYWCLSNQG